MNIKIKSPEIAEDFKQYYRLRWKILRAPWHQAEGSEKDELENESIHHMAILDNRVVAIGRLHFINETTAQICYMAVANDIIKKGAGTAILVSLEDTAKEKNIQLIILHAREAVVGFYKKQGYQLLEKTHLLFNKIQHYKMQKVL